MIIFFQAELLFLFSTNLDTSLFSLSSSSVIYEKLHFPTAMLLLHYMSYCFPNYCWRLDLQFVFLKMNTNNQSLLSINFTKTTSFSFFPLHLSLTVSFPACVFFSLQQFPLIVTWRWSVVTLRMSTHPVMDLCSTKFPLGLDKLCLSFQVRGEEGDIDFWVTKGGSKAPGRTVSDLGDNLEVVIFRDETCVHTGVTECVFKHSCAWSVERSVYLSLSPSVSTWSRQETIAVQMLGFGRFPEKCAAGLDQWCCWVSGLVNVVLCFIKQFHFTPLMEAHSLMHYECWINQQYMTPTIVSLLCNYHGINRLKIKVPIRTKMVLQPDVIGETSKKIKFFRFVENYQYNGT